MMTDKMSIHIRSARLADLDKIYKIECLCFSGPEIFDKELLRYFLHKTNDEIFIVAMVPTQKDLSKKRNMIGFLIAMPRAWNFYEIFTIDVHPNYRRKGTGEALMLDLEERIKERIIKKMQEDFREREALEVVISLTVYEKNEPAKKLYQKLGYQKQKIIPNYYLGEKNGIRMQKQLIIRKK
ncbi:MAG: GNAT family N-acetyltransferase [Candidatus Heimdallarchaeota archaeon]|nr:GNAT family N-acetyltransferase [Candidatus Heimdallarchaeota archaeon]